MLKKWAALLLTTVFTLSACHSPAYNQTEGNVADVVVKTANARHQFDAKGKLTPSLLIKQGLYVDTSPISLERRPQWLRNHVVIRGDQLPFSYYSRTVASGASGSVLTKYQTGLDPAMNVTLNYSGTIAGALDLLAAKTGYVYSVHGNTIYWQALITKTFDVAFMPGGTDYLLGKDSSSGSGASSANTSQQNSSSGTVSSYVSSDSSDSEFSSLKGSLSIWKDLDTTIKQLLSPQGKVVVSESTTSVTVNDKPSNVELVGQYIHNLNNNLSKQVLVKIQILDIKLQSGFEFGIDWQLVTNAFHNSSFGISGNYGTPIKITALTAQTPALSSNSVPQLGLTGLNTDGASSYTILLNALSQQGKTSVVSEPRVVCLNNQVSVVRIVQQEGYAASVQNTSLGSSSSTPSSTNTVTSQITPGSVITGVTLYILPKILKNNIYLQINADLSTNNGFSTFTSGATTTGSGSSATTTGGASIQLPNITEKHFNQRSMIRSGETLILSGFRQVANGANANQFLNSQALGGMGSQQLNTETIVLITPIILDGST